MPSFCKLIRFCIAICLTHLIQSPELKAMQMGTSFSFRGDGILSLHLKNHSYMFFGGRSFSVGPIVHTNWLNSAYYELMPGLGFRAGNTWFVEIDGGYVLRRANNTTGMGVGGIFAVGFKPTKSFQVFIPIVFRFISNGLNKRVSADSIPYIGFNLEL